jgi:hypothetical protein
MIESATGRWVPAPDGLQAWQQPDGSLWRQAPDGTWVPLPPDTLPRQATANHASTVDRQTRFLNATRWTILAGLVGAAVGVLLPWVTAVFVSVSGLDTSDGKLYGAVVLGAVLFAFLRFWTGRMAFGVLMLLAFLAMAAIAVYDLVNVATAPSGPFGISANPGSGLYLDAAASMVASVASGLDLLQHPRRVAPVSARARSRRALWITLVVAAAVVIGGVTAAVVAQSGSNSSETSPGAGRSRGAVRTTAAVGQPFENDGLRITVVDVVLGRQELPDSGDMSIGDLPTLPSNGQFVLVYLTVTNASDSPKNYEDGTDSILYDSRGRQFAECECDYFDVTNNSGFRETQQPTTTVDGFLAFDVPLSVTQVQAVAIQPDGEIGTTNKPTVVAVPTEPAASRTNTTAPSTTPAAHASTHASAPGTSSSAPAALECRVERFDVDDLKFEVLPGTVPYDGRARVDLIQAGRGITFPVHPVVRVYSAGSSQNWHEVPAEDKGASAEPDTCTATAIG